MDTTAITEELSSLAAVVGVIGGAVLGIFLVFVWIKYIKSALGYDSDSNSFAGSFVESDSYDDFIAEYGEFPEEGTGEEQRHWDEAMELADWNHQFGAD